MSFSLGNTLNAAKGILLGQRGTPSHSSAPNIGYLINNKLDTPDYGFLKSTGSPSPYYNRLMSGINAPSSVDAVRSDITGQQYNTLLDDIDRNTGQSLGSTATSLGRRGLINPGYGVSSNIAGNALASVVEAGNRDKANAGLAYQQSALDLQKAREDAQRQALLTGYSTEAGNANSNQQLYAQLLQGIMNAKNSRDIAYATSQNSTGGTTAQPGVLQAGLDAFAGALGKKLGS